VKSHTSVDGKGFDLHACTQAIERMKEEIYREHPERQLTLEYMQLDLASFQSTKDFTDAFKERNLPLHLLINNAGVAWVPYSEFFCH